MAATKYGTHLDLTVFKQAHWLQATAGLSSVCSMNPKSALILTIRFEACFAILAKAGSHHNNFLGFGNRWQRVALQPGTPFALWSAPGLFTADEAPKTSTINRIP